MKRLFDDPALPSDVRSDLQRSQRAGRDYDSLAKLSGLRSALLDPTRQPINAQQLQGSDVLGAGHQNWAALHVAPWAWKLAVIAAIAGASVFAAWPAQRNLRSVRPAVTMQPAERVAAKAPVDAVEVPQRALAEPSEPVPEPIAPRPLAHSSRREISQLQRIRGLLERDPGAAYRLAQRSEQEFPHGVLSEERRALQVLALAKSGETEAAKRSARQFFARYPESPLRELLTSALNP